MMIRRQLKHWFIAALCAAAPTLVLASPSFPERNVTLVVPTPPGGPLDYFARLLAPGLEKLWNKPIIVDNRPGAGTAMGADFVARAQPDGHTLLVHNVALTSFGAFQKKPLVDAAKDFQPLSLIATTPYFLIVPTAEGVKSYEEFVAKAKAKPGAMNFGVIPNSQLQLDTTRILRASGVEAELIPYAGTAPITTALLGHEINAYLGTLSGMKQYFDSGRLMPLATTSAMPTPLMPELPTFTSKGVNVEATAWYAVSTTAGVPADVVEKIAHDLRTVIESPDYVAKVQAAGYEPTSSTPAELAKIFADNIRLTTEISREIGIELQ